MLNKYAHRFPLLLKRAAIALALFLVGSGGFTVLLLFALLALFVGNLGTIWFLRKTAVWAGVPFGFGLVLSSLLLMSGDTPSDQGQATVSSMESTEPELAEPAPVAPILTHSRSKARALRQRQIWLAIADGLNAACGEQDERERCEEDQLPASFDESLEEENRCRKERCLPCIGRHSFG